MSKICQPSQGDSLKHKEQLSLLAQLKILLGFQVTNFGTNSNLNLPYSVWYSGVVVIVEAIYLTGQLLWSEINWTRSIVLT
jgi:hypothetical protein